MTVTTDYRTHKNPSQQELENYPEDFRLPFRQSDFVNENQPFWVKYKHTIIIVTLIAATLSTVYAFVGHTPKFKSYASVIIKDSALMDRYVTKDVGASTTSSLSSNPVLNTLQLLKSENIVQALWSDFLAKNPEAMSELEVENYRDWELEFKGGSDYVTYHNVPGTDVISLGFLWTDPLLAKEGLNTVLKAFQQSSLKLNQSEYGERHQYLTIQAQEIQDELAKVRDEISGFKASNNTYDIGKELENYSRDKIDFELELKKANAEASSYLAQRRALESSLGMSTAQAVKAVSVGRNHTLNQIYENYYDASAEYADLRARYKPEHPKMKQLSAKLEQIKTDIQRETGQAVTDGKLSALDRITDDTRADAVAGMLEADAKYRGASIKTSMLQKHFNNLEQKMQTLPQLERSLAALKQKEKSLSESLDNIQRQELDAKIRMSQTLSNVFVISSPGLPKDPQPPSKSLIILGGLLLGLAAGVALANVQSQLDKSKERSEVDTSGYRERQALRRSYVSNNPDDDGPKGGGPSGPGGGGQPKVNRRSESPPVKSFVSKNAQSGLNSDHSPSRSPLRKRQVLTRDEMTQTVDALSTERSVNLSEQQTTGSVSSQADPHRVPMSVEERTRRIDKIRKRYASQRSSAVVRNQPAETPLVSSHPISSHRLISKYGISSDFSNETKRAKPRLQDLLNSIEPQNENYRSNYGLQRSTHDTATLV